MSKPVERSELHDAVCPLAAVDRRLEDVHRHWHSGNELISSPKHFVSPYRRPFRRCAQLHSFSKAISTLFLSLPVGTNLGRRS